jgi:PAS domain S-box-containing protein
MDGSIRALYVDDEPGLLVLCKTFLERSEDLIVDTAGSPLEALEKMLLNQYNVIVCDQQMPGMTGIELLKYLRSSGNNVPFILFTGKGREEVVIEAYNSGASFYLQKGGDPASQYVELGNKIRHAVAHGRADSALRESEQRFRSVFDNANDAMIISDMDGRILECNDRACKMSGLARDDLVGPSLVSDIAAKASLSFSDLLNVLKERGEVRFETTYQVQGEERIVTEVNARLIPYDGGTAILCLVRDITDRKREEEKLQRSERKFRAIFDGADVGISALGADGQLIDFNDRMVDLLGYSREELGGMNIALFTHPDDIEASLSSLDDLWAGRTDHYDLEKRYVRKDGGTIWTHVLVSRVEPRTGEPPLVLIIVNDITKRKEAEEELKASQMRLTLAMNMANLVEWEYDFRTDNYTFNDDFYALYGTSSAREGGYVMSRERYGRAFVHPQDLEAFFQGFGPVLERQDISGTVKIEHRIMRRDGEVRHIMVHACLVNDETGAVVKSLGANQDITELKTAEEALRKASGKLALLNNITRHDLNNQITLLGGHLMLLKGRLNDPVALARTEIMAHSINALGSMLKFARDYQAMGVASPHWQPIREPVQDPLGFIELESLELSERAQQLEVFADPMLGKVINNLIENSIKYGGSPISVAIDCSETEEGLLLVYTDTGEGIPLENKERIFEQGFGKGTGLGLFLSREILAITGITIRESGRPGEGARFEMAIPKGKYRFVRRS